MEVSEKPGIAERILRMLFPTPESFENYRIWRIRQEEEAERRREYQRQMEELRKKALLASSDADDEDYDPMADLQWKSLNWGDLQKAGHV